MRSVSLTVLVILVISLAIAGCMSQQPPAQPQTTVPTPEPVPTTAAPPVLPVQFEGQWVLQIFGVQNGNAVTYPTTELTLFLNRDGNLSGYSGCNNYFATFTLDGIETPKGQGMTVSGLGSTKKYCQDYANQEEQYLAILGKTAAYSGDGTRLILTATTGDSLVFKRPQGTVP